MLQVRRRFHRPDVRISVSEQKKILDQKIVELKKVQELEEERLEDIRKNSEDVVGKTVRLSEYLAEVDEGINLFDESIERVVDVAFGFISEFHKLLEAYKKTIILLEGEIVKQQQRLEDLKQEQVQVFGRMKDEEFRVERKGRDIKIYEERLKKYLIEAGMEDKIKIIFV